MSGPDEIRLRSEELQALMRSLSPKELRRAIAQTFSKEARRVRRDAMKRLKGKTFSKEARRVRRDAMKRLKGKTIRDKKIQRVAKVAQTIRSGMIRDYSGYYVAARPHGVKSMHINRQNKLKPAAFWLNHGTKERSKLRGKGKSTGETPALNYIEETRAAQEPKSMRAFVDALDDAVIKRINRTFK